MNVFVLKIIALATMMTDHYGAIFQSGVLTYRIIGRLAFPIYCFLLVEGYRHTGNVKNYAARLFLFALISELPFDLAFYNKVIFAHQNIFFTLFIGLLTIYILDNIEGKFKSKGTAEIMATSTIIAACLLAIVMSVDYTATGIAYILLFYKTRSFSNKKKFTIIAVGMLLLNLMSSWIQQFSLLALALIYFYNEELGPKNKVLQLLFYAAYPLHLLVFYLIKANVM